MADGWACPECEMWRSEDENECSCGYAHDPAFTKEAATASIHDSSVGTGTGRRKVIIVSLVSVLLLSAFMSLFKTGEDAVYNRVAGLILIFGPILSHIQWKKFFRATLIGGFASAGIVMLLTLIHHGPLRTLERGRSYSYTLADGTDFVVDGFSLNMVGESFSMALFLLPILAIICLTWSLLAGLPFYYYRKNNQRRGEIR